MQPRLILSSPDLVKIRLMLVFFILALLVSGITAIPLIPEIDLLFSWFGPGTVIQSIWPAFSSWISFVHQGLHAASQTFPFLLYGTDWLAFAHIVIAIAFLGPFRDPVRNRWVVQFGMIACLLIIPTALIFGNMRGIPLFSQILDCSFGVIGIVPLWWVDRKTRVLEKAQKA